MTRALFASARTLIVAGIALAIPGLLIAAVGMELLDHAEDRHRNPRRLK